MRYLRVFAVVALAIGLAQPGRAADTDAAAASGKWLRPGASGQTSPIWGHADGLSVGLSPLPGPRGLLRIYAPYIGDNREGHVFNFLAIEPIVQGNSARGLSELETSQLDGRPGKWFWSVDDPHDTTPLKDAKPVSGWTETHDGVDFLHVWIQVEPFDNGAHVYLRLTFRSDRPHEVGVATFAHADSRPLDRCIVTATMGNYARLRRLQLADRTVNAHELWPDYRGDAFTPHARFPLHELLRTPEGDVLVVATPDETSPENAEYAPGTRLHWHYRGPIARQTWRAHDPPADLEAWVNGRWVYWGSQAPIPGGIAFENFELNAPFRQGQEFWFGVEPLPADASRSTSPSTQQTSP